MGQRTSALEFDADLPNTPEKYILWNEPDTIFTETTALKLFRKNVSTSFVLAVMNTLIPAYIVFTKDSPGDLACKLIQIISSDLRILYMDIERMKNQFAYRYEGLKVFPKAKDTRPVDDIVVNLAVISCDVNRDQVVEYLSGRTSTMLYLMLRFYAQRFYETLRERWMRFDFQIKTKTVEQGAAIFKGFQIPVETFKAPTDFKLDPTKEIRVSRVMSQLIDFDPLEPSSFLSETAWKQIKPGFMPADRGWASQVVYTLTKFFRMFYTGKDGDLAENILYALTYKPDTVASTFGDILNIRQQFRAVWDVVRVREVEDVTKSDYQKNCEPWETHVQLIVHFLLACGNDPIMENWMYKACFVKQNKEREFNVLEEMALTSSSNLQAHWNNLKSCFPVESKEKNMMGALAKNIPVRAKLDAEAVLNGNKQIRAPSQGLKLSASIIDYILGGSEDKRAYINKIEMEIKDITGIQKSSIATQFADDRINAHLKLQRILGSGANGAAMSAEIGHKELAEAVVVKTLINLQGDSLEYEYFVNATMNQLSTKIPHFVRGIMFFRCSSNIFQRVLAKDPKAACDMDGPQAEFLVIERAAPGTTFFDVVKDMKHESELISVYIQVLIALQIAQDELDFTHYDLHSANVLMCKVPDSYSKGKPVVFKYYYKGKELMSVPLYNNMFPVVIDFGRSHVKRQSLQFLSDHQMSSDIQTIGESQYNKGFCGIWMDRANPVHDMTLLATALRTYGKDYVPMEKFYDVVKKLRESSVPVPEEECMDPYHQWYAREIISNGPYKKPMDVIVDLIPHLPKVPANAQVFEWNK